jgi:hypothetical protein
MFTLSLITLLKENRGLKSANFLKIEQNTHILFVKKAKGSILTLCLLSH